MSDFSPPPGGPISGDEKQDPKVLDCFSEAIEKTINYLFRGTGSIKRWFAVGFVAFLVNCGRGGGSGFGFPSGFNPGAGGGTAGAGTGQAGDEFKKIVDQVVAFNDEWSSTIVLSAVGIFLISLIIVGLLQLIFCRMEFVFLHNISEQDDLIQLPFSERSGEGFSLAIFRVIMLAISTGLGFVALLFLWFFSIIPELKAVESGMTEDEIFQFFLGLVWDSFLLILPLTLFYLGTTVLHSYVTNFVVPVMHLRREKFLSALSRCWGLTTSHPMVFVGYLFVRLLAVVVVGIATGIIGLFLCCIAWCPGVGQYLVTVASLPLIVFLRCQGMLFMQQFGDGEFFNGEFKQDFHQLAQTGYPLPDEGHGGIQRRDDHPYGPPPPPHP